MALPDRRPHYRDVDWRHRCFRHSSRSVFELAEVGKRRTDSKHRNLGLRLPICPRSRPRSERPVPSSGSWDLIPRATARASRNVCWATRQGASPAGRLSPLVLLWAHCTWWLHGSSQRKACICLTAGRTDGPPAQRQNQPPLRPAVHQDVMHVTQDILRPFTEFSVYTRASNTMCPSTLTGASNETLSRACCCR